MALDSILITGTTSGVGRALLEHCVARKMKVISVNRRRDPALESRYPSVQFECADVRCAQDVEQLLAALVERGALPDAFVLNAGINRVDNDESFQLAAFTEVLDTNLYGVLNFVRPLTRLPPGPTPRHVLAVSSLASYVGNPYGLGYHASKRALSACFDVWARMYAGTDLVFQQVMLGPVPTAIYTMSDELPSYLGRVKDAFSVPPSDAARAIARLAETRKKKLFYPRRAVPLYLGMWLARGLIPGFFVGRNTLTGQARRRSAAPRSASQDG